MKLKVTRTLSLKGTITPPSSKSQSIRGILLALASRGVSTLNHVLQSSDTQDALEVARQFGATQAFSGQSIEISSLGLPLNPIQSTVYSGNSGITTLFLMPLLGLRANSDQPLIMDCGEQMRLRPVAPLVEALRNLGMTLEYRVEPGKLPIRIEGELLGGVTEVDGSVSQYLSALLIALPCAKNDSVVQVKNLRERPYVDMTLQWLDAQGIQYRHESMGDTDRYSIPGRQQYSPFQVTLSGDYSSASTFIAAGSLLPGRIEIEGLNQNEPQGDKELINILKNMGADISIESNRLIIQGGKPLTGITIDAKETPDLLPTLAVIGTFASGETHIRNVAHARIKETDRIHSMTEGLSRLGAHVIEHADGITLCKSQLKGNSVQGYGDHRTVMALSLAGMLAEGTTLIDDLESINKTFPDFVQLMKSLGAKMEIIL